MIRRTVTRGASVVLAALLIALSPSAHAVQPGDMAPEWELTDGDGRDIVFPAHAEGAPSVLFFWATWCPYCHAVMPYLQQIQDDYADARVRIYAIDFKDYGEPVSHMAELGYRVDYIFHPMKNPYSDRFFNRLREEVGRVVGLHGATVLDGDGFGRVGVEDGLPDRRARRHVLVLGHGLRAARRDRRGHQGPVEELIQVLGVAGVRDLDADAWRRLGRAMEHAAAAAAEDGKRHAAGRELPGRKHPGELRPAIPLSRCKDRRRDQGSNPS